jgi:alkylation response protein AidB-like acyl-CoA dehydrogenase
MDFTFPSDVARFREELRDYLDRTVTPELMAEVYQGSTIHAMMGPTTRAFWRQLGADGYLGLGFPAEYGGGGKSVFYLHAFRQEMDYRRLPMPVVTISTVAPSLVHFGTEEQKRQYLPGIFRGEIEFAIGYSEPEAGTDLASLKTTAVRDGDYYVINGQKSFTSGAHFSDYIWLAVRTDPEAPKHRGISLLIVPTNSEGIMITEFETMTTQRTNLTFYDNVRVPVTARVGEENAGWKCITTQLDYERVAISPLAWYQGMFDRAVELVREHGLENDPYTRTVLTQAASELSVLGVMDLKATAMVENGQVPVADASLLKVMSNEALIRFAGEVLQILGSRGLLRQEADGALFDATHDTFERKLRGATINLFGGGNNDTQRDIIGTHALQLPR